jgi:hypothetical protein
MTVIVSLASGRLLTGSPFSFLLGICLVGRYQKAFGDPSLQDDSRQTLALFLCTVMHSSKVFLPIEIHPLID